MERRTYIQTLASIGTLGAAVNEQQLAAATEHNSLRMATEDDTHHPGPPRFTTVGEGFQDMMFIDFDDDHIGGKDRDNLAPSIVGTPQQDPDNYAASDFEWSIKSKPSGSSADLMYAPPDGAEDDPAEQYDPGTHNAVEFIPDTAGEYILELDAPDGTHEQWIYAFPEPSDAGGPPRIEIEGRYDEETDEFVLESNPQLAPNSSRAVSDIEVYWRADDRDALSFTQLGGSDSWTIRIPTADLNGEDARLHAAGFDGDVHSMTDTVVLDPDSQSVEYPNRPPEWMEDGVMYQIFPRSFMGPPEPGEWPFENSNANFDNFSDKLDYLEELGIDVIWFTPIVPGESSNWKPQAYKRGSDNINFKYSGGGPHGYDALTYLQVAEDLGSEYSIDDYYDDPQTRQAARENALEEFKSFMDAAHDRDIKICFDLVINHSGRHHPFFQDTIASKTGTTPDGWTYQGVDSWDTNSKYFDWFDRKDAPITTDSGDMVEPAPSPTGFAGLRVMPNLNYANVALREHILSIAEFWSGEVGIDAFRCDIAYGVVHSLWKEVREIVRGNNTEFMMLDETIPNDPSFAENEFDMHFDTSDFMGAGAHEIAKGNKGMQDLYGLVDKRKNEGWPDHTLLVNSTGNHDEYRTLDLALDNGLENPEKVQRAVWAAGVTLPGVPFVYYGQERQLSKYGTERFDYDGSGEDPRTGDGDVGPGNPSRAFMNWEENGDTVPEDHLEFYQDVLDYYHEDDLLKPGADLSPALTTDPFGDILAFRRQDGDEARVVLVNASDGMGYIDVHQSVSTRDRFTGDDVAVDGGADGYQRVEFDTIAILDAPPTYDIAIEDAAGDDVGPGNYRYPTNTDYGQDSLDIAGFRADDAGRKVHFEVDISGGIDNPWNYPDGFSVQHLQVYLRDPAASGGTTRGRAGTNLSFTAPYHYRVVVDGENGARLEDATGDELATGSVTVENDTLHVEVPTDPLGTDLGSMEIAPLLFGYEPDSPGNVLPVEDEADWRALGGAENDNAPHAVDAVTPRGTSQSDALAYSANSAATIPFVAVDEPHSTIKTFSDTTGDDTSRYTYPTSPDFQDGSFDISEFSVAENHSNYRFTVTFDVDHVRNPFDLPKGFSTQFLQFYLRDPDGSGPSTTTAWDGLGASLSDPYHYRLVVNGESDRRLEAPDGSGGFTTVSTEVNVSVHGDTIAVDIPKSAIDGDLSAMDIASIVAPYDGTNSDNLRVIESTAGDYAFGGGTDGSTDTRVIDAITPDGTTVGDIVDSGTIPYVTITESEPTSPLGSDLDGDGLNEDVDGDGDTDLDDAVELFGNRNSDAVQDNEDRFDFNGNGRFDLGDIVELYNEVIN